MAVNKQIAQLMTKEMDRKDFLKYSGGVLLAVIGVSGLLNTLLRLGGDRESRGGYGGSAYGR
ncbi:MAG TPA: hypothetical protein VFS14_04640 [Candidatus Saccharimonadales bacterium]|nr:hypothetical protein [Candidatus Saccharimonadales bacterium]